MINKKKLYKAVKICLPWTRKCLVAAQLLWGIISAVLACDTYSYTYMQVLRRTLTKAHAAQFTIVAFISRLSQLKLRLLYFYSLA